VILRGGRNEFSHRLGREAPVDLGRVKTPIRVRRGMAIGSVAVTGWAHALIIFISGITPKICIARFRL
jgi:hypothetical protein